MRPVFFDCSAFTSLAYSSPSNSQNKTNMTKFSSSRTRQRPHSIMATKFKAVTCLLLLLLLISSVVVIPSAATAETVSNSVDNEIQNNDDKDIKSDNSPSSSDHGESSSAAMAGGNSNNNGNVVRIASGPAPVASRKSNDDTVSTSGSGSGNNGQPSLTPISVSRVMDALEVGQGTSSAQPTANNNNSNQQNINDSSNNNNNMMSSSSSSSANNNNNNKQSPSKNEMKIIKNFKTLFTPQIEEYTLTKFDPYSFSGAPLGGWGRATRSRLASLPVRLVSDYGNSGLNLVRPTTEEVFYRGCAKFGEWIDEQEEQEGRICLLSKEKLKQLDEIVEYYEQWGMDDKLYTEVWDSTPKYHHHGDNKNEVEMIDLPGLIHFFNTLDKLYVEDGDDPWSTTGPHFTFHDAMGREFVCRAYDEGELDVYDYMDSMFNPATLYADDGVGGGYPVDGVSDDEDVKVDDKKEVNQGKDVSKKEEMDGVTEDQVATQEEKKEVVTNNDDVDVGGEEDVPQKVEVHVESFSSANADPDIMAILKQAGIHFGGDVNIEGLNIQVEMQGDNNDLSDIVRAAMQGAGINNNNNNVNVAIGSGDKEKDGSHDSSPPKDAVRLATHLSAGQILEALKKLEGLCSQLHLGWWSYEWCHEHQVRQFHVDVSADPDAIDGRKYEIQDVTGIGFYMGKTEVVNPRGMYDGNVKKGMSTTYQLDNTGKIVKSSSVVHGKKEDGEYSKPFYDRGGDMKSVMPNRLRNELQKYKIEQHRKLGNSGGIVRQQFDMGDMCEEVGINRQMSVELRCCTEDEISHWLRAKRKATDSTKEDEVPQAVLVAVQEEQTCQYRAKVCTPVLCPEAVTQAETATPIGKTLPQHGSSVGNQSGGNTEAVFHSVNENGEVTEVKIFMGTEDTLGNMNELIQMAKDGVDISKSDAFGKVMDALKVGRESKKNSDVTLGKAGVQGKSIREVLQSTLGLRPCLAKNLGW